MRHSRFWSWLDELTDHPILAAVKKAIAGLLLLALLSGLALGLRGAWRYQQEVKASNARLGKQLHAK